MNIITSDLSPLVDKIKKVSNDYVVVFADDEKKICKYFAKMFNRYDQFCQIVTEYDCEGTRNAIDKYGEQIAILIVDERMPDGLGHEVLQYAHRKIPLTNKTLISANCLDDLKEDYRVLHANYPFLSKPWTPSEIEIFVLSAVEHYICLANGLLGKRAERLKDINLENYLQDCPEPYQGLLRFL